MRRDKINAAILTWLTGIGRPVGDGTVPTNQATPYLVVYPLYAPRGEGSLAKAEEDRDFVYQVTSVGITREQVAWMASKVEELWLYGAAPAIPDLAVESRHSDQLGAIVPSGEQLYTTDDTYRIRVGSVY